MRYTNYGLNVYPIPGTVRRVAGGYCVDIHIDDPRTTATYATVNVDNRHLPVIASPTGG